MSTSTEDAPVADDDLRGTETPAQEVRVYINKRSIIFRRFLRNKPAVAGCIVLLVVIAFALLGNIPNAWRYDDLDAYAAGGASPSAVHWFGANTAGADVYALLVRGTQKSLLIGALVGIITPLVAAIYGTALAYFGGWVERIGLFILETMIMMPAIILIAILMNGRGGGWITLSVLLIVFGWMGTARLVRALASSLVELDYVRAARYMGAPASRTIRKHLVPNIASLVVLNVTMSIWGAILPAAVYGEFGKKAKKIFQDGGATDSDEANTLRDDVQEWRPDDNEKQVLTSGPFKWDFDAISDASITLPKNEDGVLADQVAFKSLVVYNGETDDITPLVLDGTIDYATHGFPVSTQQQWESAGVKTKKSGVYAGMTILLSQGKHKEFQDPLFRQALACAIDAESAGTVSLDKSAKVADMSGLPNLLSEQWLTDETREKLDPYDFDLDRSKSLLEKAGWKFSNNVWKTPSGDDANYKLTFQSDYADYPPSAQFIAEALTDFGIKIELDGIESPNIAERMYAGKYDMMTYSWGGGEPHPHFAYAAVLLNVNAPIAKNQGGKGMDYDLVREVEGMGKVDIQKMVTQCGEGLDEEEQKELVNKLALIYNIELPTVLVWERFGNNPCQEGPRVLAFPADDDPIWESSSYSDNPVVQAMWKGDIVPS